MKYTTEMMPLCHLITMLFIQAAFPAMKLLSTKDKIINKNNIQSAIILEKVKFYDVFNVNNISL